MQMFPTLNEQMDLIRSGTVEIIPVDELVKKIEVSITKNEPLIIKLGCDPSKPDLHIGHAVVLHKMRQFQDLGHHALLIIGDFTGMIGDPTGKNVTRPHLTLEETRINGQSYLEQATMVLAKEELEVRYNSEWLGKMSFRDVIELAAKYTVAQLLERDDFSNRYKSGQPISVHELLYPLAQAMDSAAINSDVELGGTDQKFNLLVGREIQKAYGMEPQVILTMPLLEGTDGIEKMSKSYNNYIAFNDTPRDIFGKVMSIPDNMIVRYFRYGARASEKDIKEMEEQLKSDSFNPRDAKVKTAKAIVAIYHGDEAGENALAEFDKIFKNKDIPDEIEEMKLDLPTAVQPLMDVLVLTNLVPSKKEAKRLIEQGGVMLDGEKITDFRAEIDLSSERLLKVGKRIFLKVKG
ncbi:MAG: tyrosine--tRNA ligase [Ignavibacteria bacterium GWB2_35_12]|nr:MAG: tyrosine--tRNA ligase [Ignavibacteria bacterium GWA2_35_8]OGU41736.1 MAG: tyrosine--tRNA ligase [Ignavibacteria bacterium GWB2_35_12]OGU90580.1 MAG: tyrosine--tRNA ligase [Ignavibacteria bacterium RIFOXYA2_FULL_35_10]OGV23335.1 MAG: tyrosine--tRNA ligase [Ignavibacteria bacterium RIFOXYC2_FULL_35_21]